jgi:hypothetical protein
MRRYLLPIPIGIVIMLIGAWMHLAAMSVPPPFPWQIGAALEVLGCAIGMFGGVVRLLLDLRKL